MTKYKVSLNPPKKESTSNEEYGFWSVQRLCEDGSYKVESQHLHLEDALKSITVILEQIHWSIYKPVMRLVKEMNKHETTPVGSRTHINLGKIYSIEDASKITGYSTETIRTYAIKRKIPKIKINNKVFFHKSVIKELIIRSRIGSKKSPWWPCGPRNPCRPARRPPNPKKER